MRIVVVLDDLAVARPVVFEEVANLRYRSVACVYRSRCVTVDSNVPLCVLNVRVLVWVLEVPTVDTDCLGRLTEEVLIAEDIDVRPADFDVDAFPNRNVERAPSTARVLDFHARPARGEVCVERLLTGRILFGVASDRQSILAHLVEAELGAGRRSRTGMDDPGVLVVEPYDPTLAIIAELGCLRATALLDPAVGGEERGESVLVVEEVGGHLVPTRFDESHGRPPRQKQTCR
uniref:hypothetical protein n=1 Tax=Halogeometricum rufum TaxID=553469 RepID=UPI001FE33401|nr:hypothetical protein [Halogeometricum rufum]